MSAVREAAVAGQFYPADALQLRSSIESLLADVRVPPGPPPKALVVPHAGYVYSGPVAATGYAQLLPWRERYTRIVLLGPCHRVAVRGMALSGAEVFRTPLGDVPVEDGGSRLAGCPGVAVVPATHAFEHSLEVHLPFLQVVLDAFSIVPVVVGDARPVDVATLIEALWGGSETLFIVSSDLSHYLAYDKARDSDLATARAIETLDAAAIDHHDACGAAPLRGLLLAARTRGLQVTRLDLRNSGDTAGDRRTVVGYGAWAFTG